MSDEHEPTRQAVAKNATVWERPPDAAGAPPEWTPPDVHQQLPPGWTSAIEPSSGRTYYLDTTTKTTHWSLPAGRCAP